MPGRCGSKSVAQSAIREDTGCTIVAIEIGQDLEVNPEPDIVFAAGMELILIGSAESEARFLERYAQH